MGKRGSLISSPQDFLKNGKTSGVNCPGIRVDAKAPATDVQNAADTVVVKDQKHSFIGNLLRSLNVAHVDAHRNLNH